MQILGVFGLGTTELAIIFVIVLMLFGVGKLPQVAKQLGGGIRDFNKALKGDEEEEAEAEAKKKESAKKTPGEGQGEW